MLVLSESSSQDVSVQVSTQDGTALGMYESSCFGINSCGKLNGHEQDILILYIRFPLYTEVSSFQGVIIEGVTCIKGGLILRGLE